MTGDATALAAESLLHAFRWYATVLAVTVVGWLALAPALARWHDAGWTIARTLSLLVFAYASWVAGHLGPLFAAEPMRLALVVVAVVVVAIDRRRPAVDAQTWRRIATAEFRFVGPFAFYCVMRGFSHDIIGLEKFMDFAFVNAATGVSSLPVPDPWFAGESINYYYFGHYVAALLGKLSGVPAAWGYNLMLATLFGSTFALAFAFVAETAGARAGAARGVLAAVAALWITVGGNVHGFLYGFVKPWLVDAGLVAAPRQSFLLSDPTRFVGFDPPTTDKLIHEFPAYAFYVGDLHAHLSNLPGVLLLCCTLLAWFRACADGALSVAARRRWLLVCAWLVGLFAMTNSWDALMYAGLVGVLLVARLGGALGRGRGAVQAAFGDGAWVAVIVAATAAPFLLHFRAASAAFLPTHTHTPPWQWLVLYGLQAVLAVAGLLVAWRTRDGATRGAPEVRLAGVLTATGIVLALVPEFVYLKDIYGADHYRANTAFKFGFQAFTLLTLAACVGIAWMTGLPALRRRRFAALLLFELVLVPPLYYSWFVVQGGFGVWREREWTLDGQRYLARSHPEDRAIVRWLAAQRHPSGPLIEAPGDSYSYGARISANTGVPAVLGWPVHEQLWRSSSPVVWQRRDDVNRLYEARSVDDARAVVDRYRARWIVVGRFERERYPTLDPQRLAALGRVAFRAGETFVVEVDPPAP